MKARWLPIGLLVVVCAGLVGGCDIGLGNSTSTPVRTTPVAAGCKLDLSSSKPEDTKSQAAPSYTEMSKRVWDFRDRFRSDPPSTTWNELDAYLSDLKGKRLDDWRGWIMGTVSEGMGGRLHGGLEADQTAAVIALEDPHKPISPQVHATPEPWLLTPEIHPPYVLIGNVSSQLRLPDCLGISVRFTGVVTSADNDYGRPSLYLHDASMQLGEQRPLKTVATDLQGVVVSFERTECFGPCSYYLVVAYGDGTVLFEGRAYTGVQGFRLGSVGEAAIRQLLKLFDESGFYTMKDYTSADVTDAPSAYISVVAPGKGHSVRHYQGDDNTPGELLRIEDGIDEILNTKQWISPQQ